MIFAVPTLFQTLSHLNLLKPHLLPDARIFMFGGEGFSVDTLRDFHAEFRDRARLINVYGPTENELHLLESGDRRRSDCGSRADLFLRSAVCIPELDYAILDADGRSVASG